MIFKQMPLSDDTQIRVPVKDDYHLDVIETFCDLEEAQLEVANALARYRFRMYKFCAAVVIGDFLSENWGIK